MPSVLFVPRSQLLSTFGTALRSSLARLEVYDINTPNKEKVVKSLILAVSHKSNIYVPIVNIFVAYKR